MSSRNENEVVDPALADLPPEAFDPIEGSPTPEQLEVRIRAKREQAAQDAGWITSPHREGDIEPLPPTDPPEPPPAAEEKPPEVEVEAEEEDESADAKAAAVAALPDDATDEERAAAEAEAEEEFWAGRYKTREDAERGMAEKDKTIAQLFREVHERQTQEQQQQQGQQQPVLDAAAWHEWAEETVSEGGGAQGAMAALQSGGPQGYDIYISHWLQDEDPASRAEALAFNNEVTRQFAAQQAQLAAEAAQPRQNGTAPTPADEAEAAKSTVAAKYPDFKDVEAEIDRLVVEDGALDDGTKQWLTTMANEGGVEGKARAWEYLYLVAQSTRAPVRAKADAEERKRRRASADAATIAATVSSSEGTAVRTPLSEADLAVIRKRNGIRERAGLPLLPEE